MTHVQEAELALYAGGELDGTEAVSVERHLAECVECRRSTEEIRRARAWLKSVAAEPGVGEVYALRGRVHAGQRRHVPLWVPAFAAAICAVFTVLLFRPVRVGHTPPVIPARTTASTPAQVAAPRPAVAEIRTLPPPDSSGREAVKRRHVPPRLTLVAHSNPNMPVVRVKSSDPNVVILWVVGGGSEQEKSNE